MEANGVDFASITVLPTGLIDRKTAAFVLGRAPKTLAQWKIRKIGPRIINIGGVVFYEWEEVKAMALGEKPLKPIDTPA